MFVILKLKCFLSLPVYDKIIVSRSCFWEDINTPPDTCQRATTPAFIQTEFCETCSTDGCNGAATQTVSAVLFLGVAALLAKTIMRN